MSTAEAALPPVNMLWIGERLGRNERLSMVSYLAAGHAVRLHAYDAIADVPGGVEIVDAEATAPRARMMALRSKRIRSFALASDYFRYRVLSRGLGLWSDTDVICLKPIPLKQPALFGWESHISINGAVLYLPPASPMLPELVAPFETGAVPSWVGWRKQAEIRIRHAFGNAYGPADMRWGSFGPLALTRLACRHDLQHYAERVDVFYPYGNSEAAAVFAPGTTIEAFVTPDTKAVHLWNEALGEWRTTPAPATSAVGRLMTRFGV